MGLNMNFIDIVDIIGIMGVSVLVLAYFMLQFEIITSKYLIYSVMNLVGASLLLYSLIYNWNLASIIIEIFWISISLVGIFKYFRTNNHCYI